MSKYDRPGHALYLVRPPVAPALYELKNHLGTHLTQRIRALATRHGAAYIDLNSHDYSTSDLTHIDWFDTERLSRDLGLRIVEAGLLLPSQMAADVAQKVPPCAP